MQHNCYSTSSLHPSFGDVDRLPKLRMTSIMTTLWKRKIWSYAPKMRGRSNREIPHHQKLVTIKMTNDNLTLIQCWYQTLLKVGPQYKELLKYSKVFTLHFFSAW